jgi:hypothetical protein
MLGRHIRRAGLRLIEDSLEKAANISVPSLDSLKAKKTRELGLPDANIPKVVSLPAT